MAYFEASEDCSQQTTFCPPYSYLLQIFTDLCANSGVQFIQTGELTCLCVDFLF